MTQADLLEPSFAEAVAAIENAKDLAPNTRAHWLCSLRQIAKAMDKPLSTIPARWTAARFPIGRLHHARVGANPKTLANHKSNVRAALRWFCNEERVPSRGAPLAPAWNALSNRVNDRGVRPKLLPLMRYCSAQGIAPAAVVEATLDDYLNYRASTTALASDAATRRTIARAWNGCIGTIEGWPAHRLVEPPIKTREGPTWDEFPESLRTDIEAYLNGLTRVRKNANGKRFPPCKASTIGVRRGKLAAFVRMAVREGVDLAGLTSLRALLDPDVVDRVIDAYWKANGQEPGIYTIELGSLVLGIARDTRCLDADALERLAEMRATLEDHRSHGLTEKNLGVVRQVLTGGVWRDVLKLPETLIKEAKALRGHAPVKAAVSAQMAVAIAILSCAPIRLGNLTRIALDENLVKPGGPGSPYMLVFPGYDVKNRVQLEFLLDLDLTAMIDEYIYEFRPALLRGSNERWLFPGEACRCKGTKTFGSQISERIEKSIGLPITAHQFRHIAAAMLLKHHPGNYELVRRLLGHRNIQTTTEFYCGLETTQAGQIFGDLVREQMRFETGDGAR